MSDFYSYISSCILELKNVRGAPFKTSGERTNTVNHYLKKMIYILENFPDRKTKDAYKVRYYFKLNEKERYNIVMTSNGTFNVTGRLGVKLESRAKEEEIFSYFLNRFYHINIEKIIKQVMGFAANEYLPAKLILSPQQLNELLAEFQKQLLLGKKEKKIIAIRNSKLLENFDIPKEEIKKTLVEMFSYPNNQVLIDSENFAQNKVEKVTRKRTK